MKKTTLSLILLFCSAAFAQDIPTIAVYVTGGDVSGKTKDALGAFLLDGLANSGQYRAIERSEQFLAAVEQEHVAQRSGAIDDDQIRAAAYEQRTAHYRRLHNRQEENIHLRR